MRNVTNTAKTLYLIILIIFISAFGLFWLDYIGMVNMGKYIKPLKDEAASVVDAPGDEPGLIAREEFEKEKQLLLEREENLDKREAMLKEKEAQLVSREEKIEEMRRGLEVEKQKLKNDKSSYSGYRKNVEVLADKVANMPPKESVKIMEKWEEPLIIDVLRQMDADAEEAGTTSITAYLITLLPKEKASRIMYLMTQL
jgi:Skp family chaperone for outer membrane proteins